MARLYYIDHLRAFAMLIGILVHTTTLADFGWLEVIGPISHNFRMGTFFAVSGFFAGLLLSRRSRGDFFRSRLLALGVPLLFGLVILNPVTLWMIYIWRGGDMDSATIPELVWMSFSADNGLRNFVWHLHLWFLIALICYVLVAPAALRVMQSPFLNRYFQGPLAGIPRVLRPTAIAVAVASAVIGFRIVFSLFLEPLGAPWIIRATLSYSPYYMLGLFLYGQPKLWEDLHKVDLPLIAITVALWFLPTYTGDFEVVVDIIRREFTVCSSLFSLLAIFRRFFSTPSWIGSVFSEGIYTAYLLHYSMIYVLVFRVRHLLPISPDFIERIQRAALAGDDVFG
ncbi:glucan biosynthesis protein C, partial [Rhodobacteraceae bacterium MBR-64]